MVRMYIWVAGCLLFFDATPTERMTVSCNVVKNCSDWLTHKVLH